MNSIKNNKPILINEIVINILKEFNKKIISEASKIKILTDKLGLSEENANIIDRLCGPLSIWMANKLIDYQKDIMLSWAGGVYDEKVPKEDVIAKLNANRLPVKKSQNITSIMDYIRVGLNGDISSIRKLSFQELVDKSTEWHESLEVGNGTINYDETNDIILDFRDKNGIGFYWADLGTNYSEEECERMGHCGRTSHKTIYSLRETKKIPGTKYTINQSHLTAAIGNGGTIFQLKGPKNSKPQEKYYKYIIELFYVKNDNNEYLINDFGSEYNSTKDFKLKDLNTDQLSYIYKTRPKVFDSLTNQLLLVDRRIIKKLEREYVFNLNLSPDDFDKFILGNWTIRTLKNGRKITLFNEILSGDPYELWENYDSDWKSALEYYVDEENSRKIKNKLVDIAEKNGIEFDTDLDLENCIEEYDVDDEIKRAISSAVNYSEASEYSQHLFKTLKKALGEYGKVIEMDDSGALVEIDLLDFINENNESSLADHFLNCGGRDKLDCVFHEMVYYGDIDKPKFYVDDRYYPSIDESDFNQDLSDRLLEI